MRERVAVVAPHSMSTSPLRTSSIRFCVVAATHFTAIGCTLSCCSRLATIRLQRSTVYPAGLLVILVRERQSVGAVGDRHRLRVADPLEPSIHVPVRAPARGWREPGELRPLQRVVGSRSAPLGKGRRGGVEAAGQRYRFQRTTPSDKGFGQGNRLPRGCSLSDGARRSLEPDGRALACRMAADPCSRNSDVAPGRGAPRQQQSSRALPRSPTGVVPASTLGPQTWR